MGRWHSELESAIAAGKTVFVPLTSPEVLYVRADEHGSSGAIRSKRPGVVEKSNLGVLPFRLKRTINGVGREFRTMDPSQVLGQYWTRFAALSQYEVRFAQQDRLEPLLTTKNPDHIVSAVVEYEGGGHLVFLPAFDLEVRSGSAFRGNCIDLVHHLLGVHAELSGGDPTPAPDWIQDTQFETADQRRLREGLCQISDHETQRDDVRLDRLSRARRHLRDQPVPARKEQPALVGQRDVRAASAAYPKVLSQLVNRRAESRG